MSKGLRHARSQSTSQRASRDKDDSRAGSFRGAANQCAGDFRARAASDPASGGQSADTVGVRGNGGPSVGNGPRVGKTIGVGGIVANGSWGGASVRVGGSACSARTRLGCGWPPQNGLETQYAFGGLTLGGQLSLLRRSSLSVPPDKLSS